ncbi:MAG: alpha-2-macroglobulin family protein [Bacillota bacterium]|nr:alpha-2-macroglobulin family protein [Bacillota bacterium]
MKEFWKKRKSPAKKLLMVIIAVSMIFSLVPVNVMADDSAYDPSSVTVTADSNAKRGIAEDTSFTVSGKGLTQNIVEKRITITPAVTFKVSKSGSTYKIKPDIPFDSDKLVILTLADENGGTLNKWAFQTESKFEILNTIPRNGNTYVANDAGIELYFSQSDVDLASLTSSFHINPEVKGTFKMFGNAAVFISSEPLKGGTTYSVTIDKDVKNSVGETIGDKKEFSFSVEDKNDDDTVFYWEKYSFSSFLPSETPVMSTYVASGYEDKKANVEIYSLKDDKAYLDELDAYASDRGIAFEPDMKKMTLKLSFDSPLYKGQSEWDDFRYIPAPQKLDKGYYYMKATITDSDGNPQSVSMYFQVSDLSVYSSLNGNDALVWVNSADTKKPVSGASVKFIYDKNTDSGKTGSDGSAVVKWGKKFDNTCRNNSLILKIEKDGGVFIDFADKEGFYAFDGDENYAGDDYYSYIYTDRELYLPTDKIQIWGVLRPRTDTAKKPENLKIKLDADNNSLFDNSIYEAPVTLSDSGVYKCEIPVTGLAADYYRITLTSGKSELSSSYINISDYEKPTYVMTAKPEKEVNIDTAENPAVIDVNSQFFEGTPASGLPVKVSMYESGERKEYHLKLDRDGNGTFSIKQDADIMSWKPENLNFYVSAESAEDYYDDGFGADGSVITVNRDTMLQADVKHKDGKATIDVTTNKMDLTNLKSADDLNGDKYPKNIMGAPADVDVTLTITRHFSQQTGNEAYYDFLNKKTIYIPTYEEAKKTDTMTFKTSGGKYTLADIPYENGWYEFDFNYKDGKGRNTKYSTSFFNDYNDYFDGVNRYDFYSAESGENYDLGFNEKKPLTVDVMKNEQKFDLSGDARILVAKVQKNTFDVNTLSTNEFTINYDKKYMPNFMLVGACFDGTNTYGIQYNYVDYDPSEKGLSISVKTDKDVYRPSDKVNADVEVKDKYGTPIPNADVCLSVVDEANFAVNQQYADVLGTLYGEIYYPEITTYSSSSVPQDYGGGDGMGGGDGSGEVRTKFNDNAAFLTIKTDKDGKAKTEFTLADNLTTWRITALAVSSDLKAGSSTTDVSTKLAMFLSPIVPEKFISGDTVNFSSRAYGSSVDGKDDVNYTATVTGSGVNKTVDVKTAACEDAIFKFGTLPVGDYTLTIKGTDGKLSDGIAKPFSVVDSGLEATISKITTFDDIKNINAARFPVSLGFYNSDYAMYSKVLSKLAGGYGERTDARMASVFANDLIYKECTGIDRSSLDKIADIKNDYDLLTFTYNPNNYYADQNNEDATLSALAAAALPEYINKTSMESALYSEIVNPEATSIDVASSYMGLAALGDPVLIDIQSLLKNNKGFTEIDTLRLIAGLAYAGDFDGAKKYFDKLIVPKLLDWKDDRGNTGVYYDTGNNYWNVPATGAALVTASLLHLPSADKMAGYLCENKSETYLPVLEQVIYVRNFKPASNNNASFSYNDNGKTETVDLSKLGIKFVSFSKEQFENADFKESGNVGVAAYYTGLPSEIKDTDKKTLEVTKTVTKESNVGDMEKVVIDIGGEPYGDFLIQDYIPTGARFCGFGSDDYDRNYFLASSEKQNIKIFIHCSETSQIVYYIRNVTPGVYVSEAPIVTSEDYPEWGQGERQSVIIN